MQKNQLKMQIFQPSLTLIKSFNKLLHQLRKSLIYIHIIPPFSCFQNENSCSETSFIALFLHHCHTFYGNHTSMISLNSNQFVRFGFISSLKSRQITEKYICFIGWLIQPHEMCCKSWLSSYWFGLTKKWVSWIWELILENWFFHF